MFTAYINIRYKSCKTIFPQSFFYNLFINKNISYDTSELFSLHLSFYYFRLSTTLEIAYSDFARVFALCMLIANVLIFVKFFGFLPNFMPHGLKIILPNICGNKNY